MVIGTLAIAAMLFGLPPDQAFSKKSRKSRQLQAWCVTPGGKDRACLKDGRGLLNGFPLRRRPRQVRPESAVQTASGGIVQMAFRRQARCEFGPVPTEVVTRFRGQGRLFLQRSGLAMCRIAKRYPKKLPYFCDVDLKCPIIVKADGTLASRVEERPAASTSNVGIERRAVLIFCSGHYSVTVERDGLSAYAAGYTSSVNRVRVVLVEREGFIDLEASSAPAPRVCSGRTLGAPPDKLNL